MKITKRQLRRIIKEEKQGLLREFGPRGTDGASPLIDFAHSYAGLGAAVQEQVEQVVSAYVNSGPTSPDFEDAITNVNPAALDMAIQRLARPGRMLGGEAEDVLNALDVAIEMYNETGSV